MNATEFLIQKSKQNYEIADYSASKCYFDVAVSRHYYSVYQRLLVVLYTSVESYSLKKNNGEGSHELAFAEYRKYALKKCKKKLSPSQLTDIARIDNLLKDIKRHRVESDYNQRVVSKNDFEQNFLKKLNEVNGILRIIEPFLMKGE